MLVVLSSVKILKVHETRSHSHTHGSGDEEKIMTRKQKAEGKTHENEQSPKKVKSEDENSRPNGKSEADHADEFEEFCKATRESLSIDQMKEILQMNDQDSTGPDYEVASKWYTINTDNVHHSFFLISCESFFFILVSF